MIRALPPALAILAALTGCKLSISPVESNEPCDEVGYAIARRTMECTDDGDLANQRYLDFAGAYECVEVDWSYDTDTGLLSNNPDERVDLYHCAFAIGELACELVESYGDDFELWLTASPGCPLVVEAAQ